MSALYRFLRSLRLAVVVILVIALLSILSTLIPQRQGELFYLQKYGAFWASWLRTLGLDDFFRSPLFLLPVGLFFTNLSVCSIDRLRRRARSGAPRRHGPDLIHLGLLLLIAASMLSVFGRRESLVFAGRGDEIRLPGQRVLRLLEFEYKAYEDGRPKDWISTVQLRRDGELLIPSYQIEVNKPLRTGGIRVYQSSFKTEYRALLSGEEGESSRIYDGEGFQWEGNLIVFLGIEGDRAIFESWQTHSRTGVYRIGIGEAIGPYRVRRLDSREVTGLKAVRDPGFLPVVAALMLAAAGLTLTVIQKRKDGQI